MDYDEIRWSVRAVAASSALLALIHYVYSLLTGVSTLFRIFFFAVAAVIFGIRILRKKYPDNTAYAVFQVAVFSLASAALIWFSSEMPAVINGSHAFQYPFSMKIYEKWHSEDDLLPDSLPRYVFDYSFTASPVVMQAGRRTELSFSTDPAGIAAVEAEVSSRAAGVLDLAAYHEDPRNPEVTEFERKYFSESSQQLGIQTGKAGKCMTGKIYILNSNGDMNHPYTACVVISSAESMVSYVLG